MNPALSKTHTTTLSSLAFHLMQILIQIPAWIYSDFYFTEATGGMCIPEEAFGS